MEEAKNVLTGDSTDDLFSEPFLTSGRFDDGLKLLRNTVSIMSNIASDNIQKCCDDDDTEGAIEWIEQAVKLNQINILLNNF